MWGSPTDDPQRHVRRRDDARSEARNAAALLWHSLGCWLRGASPSSTPAVASATTAAIGIGGRVVGGCRDPKDFSLFVMFRIILYGEMSLWTFLERIHVYCTSTLL